MELKRKSKNNEEQRKKEMGIWILEKWEVQVTGEKRKIQHSDRFLDIAANVMQRTIDPVTRRPHRIGTIERLMYEIHFNVDLTSNSKRQVIRELQKRYSIKRSPMRLMITVGDQSMSSLLEILESWKAEIVSKDESASKLSVVCEMDPGFYRECDSLVRNLRGRLELLAASVHFEGDNRVDNYDDDDIGKSSLPTECTDLIKQLTQKMQEHTISVEKKAEAEKEQNKCNTYYAKRYRDHFKSDWHRRNLRRKTKKLPPLTAEECVANIDLGDSNADLKEYSF